MKTNKINHYYQRLWAIALVLLISSLSSCSVDEEQLAGEQFGIFRVANANRAIIDDGVIDTNTLDDFLDMMAYYPEIETLEFRIVPGSEDDEINLQLGREVYRRGLNTELADNGEIASGGVDLFLAGRSRSLGHSPMVGVHSWTDGIIEATDLPEDDPVHQEYIDYFIYIGYTEEMARDFYFYTIEVASSDDIHYMTREELEYYGFER